MKRHEKSVAELIALLELKPCESRDQSLSSYLWSAVDDGLIDKYEVKDILIAIKVFTGISYAKVADFKQARFK